MLALQLAGVDVREDIAARARRRCEVEDERRIEVREHLPRELGRRIVALVHDDDRPQSAERLHERCLRRAWEQSGIARERFGETIELAVLLKDFADVFLSAVDAQRRIAQHANGQLRPHGIGREPRASEQRLFRVDLGASLEIPLDALAVWMALVEERPLGLGADRVGRHEPDDSFRPLLRQMGKDGLE